jgi:hypothetical protein
MNPKLLINQPGRVGDIIICLPIAHWYFLKNYDVYWLCPKEYHSIFRNINYVIPLESTDLSCFQKIIDLSFGLIQGTPLHGMWMSSRPTWQSFVSLKYHLAGVPISCRWALFEWTRCVERERALFEKVMSTHDVSYAVVHDTTWDCSVTIDTPLSKVKFEQIDDFNVFDWYAVLLEAQEIHCIDSSLCNFVDVLPALHSKRKYYYLSPKTPSQEDRTILINNWRFV